MPGESAALDASVTHEQHRIVLLFDSVGYKTLSLELVTERELLSASA